MEKQRILIVGSEKGLGLGLTEAWLEKGWDVFATHLPGADISSLHALAEVHPGSLTTGEIDVTVASLIAPLVARLSAWQFDIIFMVPESMALCISQYCRHLMLNSSRL
ncbi:hypothetical protein I9216_004048 [Citrobacter koseri]